MSDAPYPAPILRLDAYIFMNIIKINANMFASEEDALNDTRIASQVCRSWRGLIVNTPSLWGRMIDISRLEHLPRTCWAKEVIRRSGDATLWIKGRSNWLRPYRPSYDHHVLFTGLITQNWDRIQRLVVAGLILDGIDTINGVLYRPAPQLEFFHVQFSDYKESFNATADKSHRSLALFSGDAPMLRHMETEFRKINFNTSWSHNLISVKLDKSYGIEDCLSVLLETPNLQRLEITGSSKAFSLLSYAVVPLRRLEYLKLRLSFDKMVFILDHLTIPLGCSLNLFTYKYGTTTITLPEIMSTLSSVSRRFFKSHPPKTLNITCLESEAITIREDLGEDIFCDAHCVFQMLRNRSYAYSADMPTISKALLLPEFSGVTELKLCYDVSPSVEPDLSFLQCFVSVKTLHADEQLLRAIMTGIYGLSDLGRSGRIIFPKLRRVKVLPSRSTYCLWRRYAVSDDTLTFILVRREAGYPIVVLDLSECQQYNIEYYVLNRLKFISGLKIILPA